MTAESGSGWQDILRRRLPLLGHRNWIVIADSAYPLQTSPGIETILADTNLADALAVALDEINAASHVRPILYLDAELEHLDDTLAPGTSALKSAMDNAFGDAPVNRLPHEEIIAKLDAAGRNFNILLLKTRETIPYTSVFIELDCGYWSAEAEAALRGAVAAAG